MTNPTTDLPTGAYSSPLNADEYAFVMPQFLYMTGRHRRVTFEQTFRSLPVGYGYAITAGLADAMRRLPEVRFDERRLRWMASLPENPADPGGPRLFRPAYLDYLSGLRFRGEVYAVAEGTAVAPGTPLLRVTGNPTEAMMVEAALISTLSGATSIATAAARIKDAAQGRPVADNSARRCTNPQISVETARNAYLGGFDTTSNMEAGYQHGIPTYGTMAHCLVQMFGEDGEQGLFEEWLRFYPGRASLLPDAFDVRRGVERAIAASVATGIPVKSARQDSGDPAIELEYMRARLDAAGLTDTAAIASDGMNARSIARLVEQGAPVDAFAVGGAVANPPKIDMVYKIVAQEADDPALQHLIKKAVGKSTDPGAHQVYRTPAGDVLCLTSELYGGQALLQRVMAGGRLVENLPTLEQSRARCLAQVAALPERVRIVDCDRPLELLRSPGLVELRERLGDPSARDLPVLEPRAARA